MLPPPCLDPQIEDVVQVDVRQQRRCTAALRRPLLTHRQLPLLQHACVQPFLHQPHHAPVPDPVLDELRPAIVVRSVSKKPRMSQVEHPVHLLRVDPDVERVQRIVLAAPRPEPIREAEKVLLRRSRSAPRPSLAGRSCPPAPSIPERSLPTIGFRDVRPPHRLRPIRSSLQSMGQVVESFIQRLAVVLPRLSIHARRRFPLQRK